MTIAQTKYMINDQALEQAYSRQELFLTVLERMFRELNRDGLLEWSEGTMTWIEIEQDQTFHATVVKMTTGNKLEMVMHQEWLAS